MKKRQQIAVLTGAGMSAESGISTFRDSNGLWENHNVMDVASPEGWRRNPELVLDFYNARRRQLKEVQPNLGHTALLDLEVDFDVHIITQNVDNLHERAGSSKIIHLHGELTKVRSTLDERLVYHWEEDVKKATNARKDLSFGLISYGLVRWCLCWIPQPRLVEQADIIIIIGTSMQVNPAASLVGYAQYGIPIYYIDPKPSLNYELKSIGNLHIVAEPASTGVKKVVEEITGKKGKLLSSTAHPKQSMRKRCVVN